MAEWELVWEAEANPCGFALIDVGGGCGLPRHPLGDAPGGALTQIYKVHSYRVNLRTDIPRCGGGAESGGDAGEPEAEAVHMR